MEKRIQADMVSAMKAKDAVKLASLRANGGDGSAPQPKKNQEKQIGRNDPCPCGSGKKYKQCCGK